MTRFCGNRFAGGIYIVTTKEKLEQLRTPMLNFIVDPPVPIENPNLMGISAQGQSYLPIAYDLNGQPRYAVYDWIGGDYPSPADFVEEFMRQGLSTRAPLNSTHPETTITWLKKLPQTDVLRFVHPRAIILPEFIMPFLKDRKLIWGKECIRNLPEHITDELKKSLAMCASLWWEDLPSDHHNTGQWKGPRIVKRHGGDTEYVGAVTPKGAKPKYMAGVILEIPMSAVGLDVIMDGVANEHQEALDIIAQAGIDIPVRLCSD